MPEIDRAAASREPPLTLEAYEPRRRGGPAPVTLLVSLLALVLATGGVAYLYRGGLRDPGAAPVGAPVTAVKTPAPLQPEPLDPGAGLTVYKAGAEAAEAPPTFTPPPEAPLAAAPLAEPAAPPAPTNPAPTPNEATPAADAVAPKTAAPSGYIVRIGASKSEDLAKERWEAAAAAVQAEMAGKGQMITPVQKEDGGILYRVAVTGFDTKDAAQSFCDKLRAAGKHCVVQ
jgi:hypothetical protein